MIDIIIFILKLFPALLNLPEKAGNYFYKPFQNLKYVFIYYVNNNDFVRMDNKGAFCFLNSHSSVRQATEVFLESYLISDS